MPNQITVHQAAGVRSQGNVGRVTSAALPWDQLEIAFVDNGKPNAAALLAGVADALGVDPSRRTVIAKQIASRPMNKDEREVLAARCHVAVMAVGD